MDEQTLVKLSGSNSIGFPTGIASFRWTQVEGEPVQLSDSAAVEPTFFAQGTGIGDKSLKFELTVTGQNGEKTKDNCIVNVTGANAPPEADAGRAQTVSASEIVVLDGFRSSDPDDGIASYSWKQISGRTVVVSDRTSPRATFEAPRVDADGEALVFRLAVTDFGGLRARDTCIVNVSWADQPPVAEAGADRKVRAGTKVALNGSASRDQDDGIVSCRWRQIAGRPVTLSDPLAIKPTFSAPETEGPAEDLVFLLTVTDIRGLSHQDKVIITVLAADPGPSGTYESSAGKEDR